MGVDRQRKGIDAKIFPVRSLKIRVDGDLNHDALAPAPVDCFDIPQEALAFLLMGVDLAHHGFFIKLPHV